MRTLVFGALALAACGGSTSGEARRGQVVWLKNIAGSNGDALRSVVDARDQVTVAVFNTGAVDMGGGPLGTEATRHLVLARYDSSGGHLWSKTFAGGFGTTVGLAVTGSGDVVMSLDALTSATDLGGGTLEPTAPGTSIGVGVLATFEGDSGSLVWARQLLAGTRSVVPGNLALDGSGDILAAGKARVAYDDGGNALPTPGDERIFVGKFASVDGSLVWQTDLLRSDLVGQASSVAATDDGSVYAAATYAVPDDPELAPEEQPLDPHLVAKLSDANGSIEWTQTYNFVFSGALGVAVDAGGNPVVAGDFLLADPEDDAQTTRQPLVTVVQLASLNGAPVWWTPAIGTGIEGDRVELSGVTYDDTGNVVVGGRFSGTVDFAGRTLAASSYALFVLKLDGDGNSQWVRHSGGTGDVTVGPVVTDRGANIVASGMFQAQAGEGEAQSAANEVFVLKLSP